MKTAIINLMFLVLSQGVVANERFAQTGEPRLPDAGTKRDNFLARQFDFLFKNLRPTTTQNNCLELQGTTMAGPAYETATAKNGNKYCISTNNVKHWEIVHKNRCGAVFERFNIRYETGHTDNGSPICVPTLIEDPKIVNESVEHPDGLFLRCEKTYGSGYEFIKLPDGTFGCAAKKVEQATS